MRNREPHIHCPYDHDHPQPFSLADVQEDPAYQRYGGKTFCGACYHRDGLMTEMVVCTPETCPGDAAVIDPLCPTGECYGLCDPEAHGGP